MAEANANIKFTADNAQALEGIRQLQRQVSRLFADMSRGAASAQAATAGMQQNLVNSINSTGQFTAKLTTIRTTTESFTNSLEKNKLSLGQYFRFGVGATKNFGKVFTTEFNTIDKVARERVKNLQTQYIKMGRDASGAMKAIAVRPTTLDMTNLGTQTAIAAQKQAIFNQLLKQGTTNLLNFGKNTQWAGRQLMVGFTLPLSIFAMQAARSFQQLEAQAINFKRVYGDLFTTPEQTEMALTDMRKLALEFTKLGVSVEETLGLAAKVSQMGNTGAALTAQVTQATRLSVLGQMEQQEALDTTIGITNAFGIAIEDLADKVNFLNAAENQTILAIQDFNEAVPRAGSVVSQLGGGVEDLAFFLTAMREGGIEASQGANALKTSLARLISPTEVAKKELGALGINIGGIVEANAGNLRQTVIDLALALDTLDPLDKSRAIEQLFGKFQFARMSALFQNIIDEGSQANRVLELMGMSAGDLARLADRELGRVEESSATKFTSAIEKFKSELAPIGEEFLKLATPIIKWATQMIEGFNRLGEGSRGFVVGFLGVIGGLAPVLLMVIGLIANLVANLAKGVGLAFNFFQRLAGGSKNVAEQTQYLTAEQLEAQTIASSLNQTHQTLSQTFTGEAAALHKLAAAYRSAITEMGGFAGPIMTAAGPAVKAEGFAKGRMVPGYKDGVIEVPGPKGKGDIIPAMLAPGEAVIPAEMAQRYGGLINAMIAGNIPGYEDGSPVKLLAQSAYGHKGTSPKQASHLEERAPKALGSTMMQWIQTLRDGATANTEHTKKILDTSLTVKIFGEKAEDGTQAIETLKMSVEELADYVRNNPDREILTGGQTFPGTTIVEDAAINQAYSVPHPDGQPVAAGAPASLDSAILAGNRAAAALEEQADQSSLYSQGLRRLIARGEEASASKAALAQAAAEAAASGRELTAQERAAAEQQAFLRQREKEVIILRIKSTSNRVTDEQASQTAEELLTQADLRLAEAKASGVEGAEYMRQVEAQYASHLFEEIQTRTSGGRGVTVPLPEVFSVPEGQGAKRDAVDGRSVENIVNRATGERATRSTTSTVVNRATGESQVIPDLPPRGIPVAEITASRDLEAQARAQELGRDIAEATATATTSGIDKYIRGGNVDAVVGNAGAELAEEVTQSVSENVDAASGATARGGTQGTIDAIQAAPTIDTVLSPEAQQAQVLLAQSNQQSAAQVQAFGDRAANATQKVMDMSGKAAMAGFALTSVIGGLTQVPGPLGEIARKAMPVASIFTMLAGVTRMVNAEKVVEAARARATAAAEAFNTKAKISNTVATGVSTKATVGNVIAKKFEMLSGIKLVVAKIAETVATLGVTGAMSALAVAMFAFLGPVVLGALAVAALAAGVFALAKIHQDNQARIKGLGDAAALSTDQLKVLSDELGIQFKDSVFGSQVLAGQGEAIDATEQDEVARLRESEGFKEEFGGVDEIGSIIRTLKDATDGDAERILKAQAAQMAALAKTEEDFAKIPIVLKAQLEEAGKEGIDVNVLLPDLSTLDGVAQRVQETVSPLSNIGKLSSEQLSITRGEIESTAQVLEQMRVAGIIAPEEAAEQFNILAEAVDAMEDPGQKLELMQGVLEDLNMAGLTEGIEDADALMAILQNTMLGLKIDPADLELFKAASETNMFGKSTADPAIVEEAAARADELERTAAARAADNAEKVEADRLNEILSADMAAANESMDEEFKSLTDKKLAYDKLMESGFSAAEALEAVADATFATAIAGAAAGPELDALIQRKRDLADLEAEVEALGPPKRTGSGGASGPPPSFLDDITKKLRLFNDAQTSVTKGFDASMKSILAFANGADALSGSFGGLSKQMRGIGLSENLIEMIAGMDPEEYEKRKNDLFIFDDKGTIVDVTAKLRSLNDAINSVTIGEFINTQQQLTNSVSNQITALNLLTDAGASYEAAYKMVQNTALAAAIATARSSEQIRAAANAAMEAQATMDRLSTINEEEERRKGIAKAVQEMNKEFSNQAKILDYINRNRRQLSETQINEILTSKDLQALVLEPSIDPRALSTALDNANRRAQLELSIKKLTVEGQDEIFQTGLGKAMDVFNAQGNKIEFEFEANIKDQRKIIKDAEEQIALLDFELQTYQDDLKDIEYQEDEINKAYDKRFEALDKIAEANAEISRQQKAQLDVADALSRGDIAGAARAVREAREASGEAAREQERRRLEQAQQAQLAALTSSGGLNREELEAKSLELEKQIFEIERTRLQPAAELLRLAELKRDADIESLEVLGKTREEYEKIANAIDVARGNNWKSTEAIQEALNIAEKLIAELGKAKPAPLPPPPPAPAPARSSDRSSAPAPAPAPAAPATTTQTGTTTSSDPRIPDTHPGHPAGGFGGAQPDPAPRLSSAEITRIGNSPGSGSSAGESAAAANRVSPPRTVTPPSFNAPVTGGLNRFVVESAKTLGSKISDSFKSVFPSGIFTPASERKPINWFGFGSARGGMIIPKRMSIGGVARRSRSAPPLQMLDGGKVRGPGTDMSDSIPALLSNGEYVIRASAVRNVGVDFLDKLNGGKFGPTEKDGLPGFFLGGLVDSAKKAFNSVKSVFTRKPAPRPVYKTPTPTKTYTPYVAPRPTPQRQPRPTPAPTPPRVVPTPPPQRQPRPTPAPTPPRVVPTPPPQPSVSGSDRRLQQQADAAQKAASARAAEQRASQPSVMEIIQHVQSAPPPTVMETIQRAQDAEKAKQEEEARKRFENPGAITEDHRKHNPFSGMAANFMAKNPSISMPLGFLAEFLFPFTTEEIGPEGPSSVAPIRRGATDASLVDDLSSMPFAKDIALLAGAGAAGGAAARLFPSVLKALKVSPVVVPGAVRGQGPLLPTTPTPPTSFGFPLAPPATQTQQGLTEAIKTEVKNLSAGTKFLTEKVGFGGSSVSGLSHVPSVGTRASQQFGQRLNTDQTVLRVQATNESAAAAGRNQAALTAKHVADYGRKNNLTAEQAIQDSLNPNLRSRVFPENFNSRGDELYLINHMAALEEAIKTPTRSVIAGIHPGRGFLDSKVLAPVRALDEFVARTRANRISGFGQLGGSRIYQNAVNRLPSNLRSVALTATARHRSSRSDLGDPKNLMHPDQVPVQNAQAFAGGTYLSQTSKLSDTKFSDFGENAYRVHMTPRVIKDLLNSKGYITQKELNRRGIDLKDGMKVGESPIRELVNEGFVGFQHLDALTNWKIGVNPAVTFKATTAKAMADSAESIATSAARERARLDAVQQYMSFFENAKSQQKLLSTNPSTFIPRVSPNATRTLPAGAATTRRSEPRASLDKDNFNNNSRGIPLDVAEKRLLMSEILNSPSHKQLTELFQNSRFQVAGLQERQLGVRPGLASPHRFNPDLGPDTTGALGPTRNPFVSPTQSRTFLNESDLEITSVPSDTDFKVGVNKNVNFMKDLLSDETFFAKDHAAHYLNNFEIPDAFGYEFLAGRIGNLIGARTPQAYVISRGPGRSIYQVATDAIPSSSGLAPEKIEQIIMASSNPQKTLTDMLEAYADFNEVTPALNSLFNNRDLHRNNIMWDNLNRRFMQIDMGSSAPNTLRYPPKSEAFKNNRVHHGISESKEGAIKSMAIVRAAISDAIDTAIDFGFLNRPSQLSLAERARSLGFSVSPDSQSLNPLKGVFKKATVSTDLSGAYSKIMNLDIEGLPSQLAKGLGLKDSFLNNIDKGLIATLKERAEVLAEITSNPKITIGQEIQVPAYRLGGLIPYKATGGMFKSQGSDTIPAMLTPGEFVVRKSAVENFGVDNLEKINNGTYDSSSMYNYNLSINVKSESNPDQIARTVIDQIKRIDSQRIRGNRY